MSLNHCYLFFQEFPMLLLGFYLISRSDNRPGLGAFLAFLSWLNINPGTDSRFYRLLLSYCKSHPEMIYGVGYVIGCLGCEIRRYVHYGVVISCRVSDGLGKWITYHINDRESKPPHGWSHQAMCPNLSHGINMAHKKSS